MLKKYFTPEIFFCLVIFLAMPVCVSYNLMDPFISPRVILIAAAIILFVIVMFLKNAELYPRMNSAPFISLCIFLLLSAASIVKSLNPGDAWYEWLKTFLALPVMLVTAVLFRTRENRRTMLIFSQVTVFFLSCVYIYQWLKLYFDPSLETVFGYSQNVASTLGNKNFYAELVCLLLVFSVLSFLTFKKFLKYFSFVNILLLIATLFTVKSLAAIVASAFAACVAGIALYNAIPLKKISGQKAALLGAGILVAGLAILFQTNDGKNFSSRMKVIRQYIANPALADSTARANNNSTFERIMLWRNTVQLIQEDPITGCGAGNWKLLYPKYGISGTSYIESGSTHYEHPHNDYLLLASESGLPAAIAFILFMLSIVWYAWKNIRKSSEHLWLGGILFAVTCFAVTSVFSFPRVRFYAWIQLSVFAGLLLAILEDESVTQKKSAAGIWKITLLICGVISIWALAAGIIRYQGEVHSKLLQHAKQQKNFARMVRESSKASSWYFPVDETATPFSWYGGMALFYSGQLPGAKAAYEDAYGKNPYHIQLLNDYATALEQTNDRDRALEMYRRALMITPNFPHTLLNISACYFNIGKKDSAFVYIDKIYGIRLSGQEKKSYNTYLPPILRAKIFADTLLYPEDVRAEAITLARDSAFVSEVYRNSKQKGLSFNQELTDSLRNNSMK